MRPDRDTLLNIICIFLLPAFYGGNVKAFLGDYQIYIAEAYFHQYHSRAFAEPDLRFHRPLFPWACRLYRHRGIRFGALHIAAGPEGKSCGFSSQLSGLSPDLFTPPFWISCAARGIIAFIFAFFHCRARLAPWR